MTRFLLAGAFAAATLLAGCGTTVISSTRSAALTAPVTAVTLFYVANISSSDAKPSVGTVLGSPMDLSLQPTGTRLSEDAAAFGEQVLKLLPLALRAAGLRVDPAPLQTAMLPRTPTDVISLLGAPASSPLLIVRPVSARMECPGACFVFRVEVRMLDAKSSKQLWSGSFDAPPRASRLSDFSGPAESFSQALVAQLRKDGAVK